MPLPVKLSEVVELLSLISNDVNAFLNIRTGEFAVLTSDEYDFYEDDDLDADDEVVDEDPDETSNDEPEWMKEARQTRKEVLNSPDYIQLPDKFEIHDWQIMSDFCVSIRQHHLRDELLGLIRGRGAFGRFHSASRRLHLEQDWYDYRDEAYERIARDWLEANEIPYV